MKALALAAMIAVSAPLFAQPKPKPEDTEVWQPEPKVVTPGAQNAAPPSDAIVLFDGKNLDEWVQNRDKSPAKWFVADGVLTVNKAKGVGNIETKRSFKNFSPMSLSFPNSEDRHKLWGGPPGPQPAPWPACRRLQAPESPRKERDEGVLAQRAPRPGGPPHHLCRTQLREN
jgi:hypothetical protein